MTSCPRGISQYRVVKSTSIKSCQAGILSLCLFGAAHPAAAEKPEKTYIFFSGKKSDTPKKYPFVSNVPPDLIDGTARAQLSKSAWEEEPERTAFDVFLGGTLKGTGIAQYTDSWVEIDNPKDVAEQLAGREVDGVLPLLSGRIEGERVIDGIGAIKADSKIFRLTITLDKKFFPGKEALEQQLAEPQKDFSLQQRIGAALSGSVDDGARGALSFLTLGSKGDFWGKADGALVQGGKSELNELTLSKIIGVTQSQAGFLRSPGQFFGQSLDYLGVRFKTSEDLVSNFNDLRGSAFDIFVPARSRVEFYRGQRLLSVQVFDFGVQTVDTSMFPPGSYDVDVVIREDSGNITRERRFFAKSGLLPIRSRPIFSFEGGVVRDGLNPDNDIPLHQSSVRFRAASAAQVEASLYGVDKTTLGSLGILGLYQDTILSSSVVRSNRQETGVQGSISGTLFGLGWNIYGSKSYSSRDFRGALPEDMEEDDKKVPSSIDPLPLRSPIAPSEFNLLPMRRRQGSASVQKQISDFVFRVSGTYTDSPYMKEARYGAGPSVDWRIISSPFLALTATASALRTNEGDNAQLLLSLRKDFKSWSSQSQLSVRREDDESRSRLTTYLTNDTRLPSGRGNRVSVGFEEERSSKETNDSRVVAGTWNHADSYLEGSSFVRDTRSNQTSQTSYGANAMAALNIAGLSGFAVSRPATNEAVFIAEIEADTAKGLFEVLVNSQVQDKIEPGERSVVGLPPYRSYKLAIRPSKEADLTDYENEVTSVTVFPGNVIRKVYKVKRVTIAIGRVADENGAPIGWERLKGAKGYVYTEEDGSFQAEIGAGDSLSIESSRRNCNVILPSVEKGEFFTDFGKVTCK